MSKQSKDKPNIFFQRLMLISFFILIGGAGFIVRAQNQQTFATPEEAVKALSAAAKSRDSAAFGAIFGPRVKEFVSGDDVADKNQLEQFTEDIAAATKFEKINDQKLILLVGDNRSPFAAPLVKTGSQWRFDTDAGVEELLNRRIGMNEFDAVYLCQTYALAQFEYFNGDDKDGDQVSEYAQKISSTPGQKDGLYWQTTAGDEDESPLGPLFAFAADEGYKAKTGTVKSAAPFHGYYFKILYRQGASAPGGKFNYIINGNMIAGFALVAYPAIWGNSGVMTFIVNQEGRVYEKNLGPETVKIAAAMTEYNPDVTWSLINVD